jgi:lipoate-protein ligase A
LINRRKHAELLQEAFLKADINLEISPRHDLWLDGKKISGSAFKQTKNGSFHHGTFLVSSDLNQLEESLKHTIVPTNTKSIHSVRSKVITLQEKYPGTEINDVIELICHHLKTIPFTLEGTILSEPQVQESFRQMNSWETIFGETPHFEMNDLVIHKGHIDGKKFDQDSMKGRLPDSEIERLFPDFSAIREESQFLF